MADGRRGETFDEYPFSDGDVVTVEMQRARGAKGVLRVHVQDKIAREFVGLPEDGVLYPVVGTCNKKQSYTLLPL